MGDDTGRCINCGFLGKRRTVVDAESIVYAATRYDREQGTFNRESGWPDKRDTPTYLTCFRNAASLQEELAHMLGMVEKYDNATQNDYTCELIEKPRECKSWYPWTEYSSPKEHFEEFKMQQLEKDRREFERRLTQMQIDAGAEVSKAGMKVSKVGIWIGIGAVILALAEVLTMTADSILWKGVANIISLIQNGASQ